MKNYVAIIKHDAGMFRMFLKALSIEAAIQQICKIEGCPACAIIRITEKN